jgi:DNA-binding transcriptional LysR family regulator
LTQTVICKHDDRVELRQLATFVAVAEEASFTRAAERLHVVQSAVSSGIRSLERQLGATLFARTTHRVELTDAGRALLPEARATLAAAAAAREAVDQVRGGLRGTVRLGILQAPVMRTVHVPRVLARFRAEHPGVSVEVRHAGGSATAAEQLREGGLDLAFVSLATRTAPGLTLTPLWREPFRLALPVGHRLSGATSVCLAELAQEAFAELPPGWGTRLVTDQAFAAAGVRRTITSEVNDISTVVEFVRYGLAVALMPASVVADIPDIVAVPLDPPDLTFEIAIAVPADRRRSAATEALLSTITAGT